LYSAQDIICLWLEATAGTLCSENIYTVSGSLILS